jgi:hypothetical protein
MKYLIIDTSNDGIVWVGTNLPVVNAIRRGLLDCDFFSIREHQDQYNELTQTFVKDQSLKYDPKKFKFTKMTSNEVNDIFLEKKRLAYLRSSSMVTLFRWSFGSTRKTSISHIPGIDNDITFSLLESDPENNKYEQSITEYSDIIGIPVEEGYKELKLLSDNFRTQKIRMFAYTEYFLNKINNVYTRDQLNKIDEEINRKFNLDLWI